GALDQVGLDRVAGRELVDPGVAAAAVVLGILAGEDRQPGAAAVLDGVETRAGPAFWGPGPGTPARGGPGDRGAVGWGGHGGRVPAGGRRHRLDSREREASGSLGRGRGRLGGGTLGNCYTYIVSRMGPPVAPILLHRDDSARSPWKGHGCGRGSFRR